MVNSWLNTICIKKRTPFVIESQSVGIVRIHFSGVQTCFSEYQMHVNDTTHNTNMRHSFANNFLIAPFFRAVLLSKNIFDGIFRCTSTRERERLRVEWKFFTFCKLNFWMEFRIIAVCVCLFYSPVENKRMNAYRRSRMTWCSKCIVFMRHDKQMKISKRRNVCLEWMLHFVLQLTNKNRVVERAFFITVVL